MIWPLTLPEDPRFPTPDPWTIYTPKPVGPKHRKDDHE